MAEPFDANHGQIGVRIATGGGINSGADGFAVTLVKDSDLGFVGDLGGCLGYGVGVSECRPSARRITAASRPVH